MIGMRRLSATVMLENGRGSWKLRDRPRRVRSCAIMPARSRPSKRTLPVSLLSVPHRQFTSVLLPDPFGAIRPTRSPGATEKSMFSSATNPPKRLPSPRTSRRSAAMPFLPTQIGLHKADDAVRRDDHEADQQQADEQ